MSNTKLAADQKSDRKNLLSRLSYNSVMATSMCGRVTVLLVPNDTMGGFSVLYTAYASENEEKYRRKVGEYVVLCRWYDGDFGTIVPANVDAQNMADYFSSKMR